MKKAGIFSVDWKDILKGAITATLTAVATFLYNIIGDGHMPTPDEWKSIGGIALLTFIGYVCKNFLTNSDDQFAKKESSGGVVMNSTTPPDDKDRNPHP
jgi:hypothetical protein